MRSIATFEARCGSCGADFAHPSVGDFAYGEVVFASRDGAHYAVADSSHALAPRVAALVTPDRSLWAVLAALADRIDDQELVHGIVCPHCGDNQPEYQEGRKLGTAAVPEATYRRAERLDPPALAKLVAEILGRDDAT